MQYTLVPNLKIKGTIWDTGVFHMCFIPDKQQLILHLKICSLLDTALCTKNFSFHNEDVVYQLQN